MHSCGKNDGNSDTDLNLVMIAAIPGACVGMAAVCGECFFFFFLLLLSVPGGAR